ncbi:putative AraC family transcriptional regulator [Gordonia hirsuta DSM 44140 = NBRC 16056]|uniref:Putative AraC family transcriptional regulator n=1 Tax=Gordonia hirsuta DSM 44140 = NBRC 16056 TaxID=1121927 RepID=L7LET1_9ACTN|nr:putative AraC family transcriptional regulator [Gordonia hirsuta DSM 44140 = NBRC 16056]
MTNLPELITAHGGDPEIYLRGAGIDLRSVGDYNRYIRYSALAKTLGTAAEELGLADLGLRLSRRQNLEMLGPIAALARNADSVEAGLLGVIKYLHTYSPAIRSHLRVGARLSSFEFEIVLPRVPYRAQMVELSLGVISGMFELMTDAGFRASRIAFQHAQISSADTYLDCFQAPVEFDAEADALVFPTGLLSRAIPGKDGLAYALATRYLGEQHRYPSVDKHVVELIGKLLPVGQATLVDIAGVLLMHPRALQRQLAEAGTTFEGLLDERRVALARELLAVPDLPLSVVATRLGYSEQSSLTRSCRRWFGVTPLAVRRELGRQESHPRPL